MKLIPTKTYSGNFLNLLMVKISQFRVSYEEMGKCILAQGSKLIHHVTKVESAKEDRISFIISMVPRNAYHPEVTVFHTMKHLDTNSPTGIAPYEFFRSKTWHCRVSRIKNLNFFEQIILNFYLRKFWMTFAKQKSSQQTKTNCL